MTQATLTVAHSRRLIEFAIALAEHPLPAAVARDAKRCLLDNVGCGLFGASQPWTQLMAADVTSDGTQGPCSMYGSPLKVPAPAAALVNGTAIHGFELDDLLPAAIVHAGTVIVPAVVAAAEAHDVAGARVLAAIVAGYEATARISLALGVEPSQRGFHKTSVVGPVASAIAVGIVMGLDAAQVQSAVGLACSMSSGIKAYAAGEGGGMVKRMHAGRAAEAGVRAAQLARRGFTGPPAALDGPLGLLEVFSGASAQAAFLSQGLGEDWHIQDVWLKAYPMCGWIQGAAQLLLGLRGPHALAEREVRRVMVGTSAFAVKHNGNATPHDEMEAQYSIPYCAALALTADPGEPNAFGLDAIANPGTRALAQRVELRVDAECDAVYPRRFGTRILLELANGMRKEAFTLDPHGTAADPMTAGEVLAKFKRLAKYAPREIDAAAIAEQVEHIDALPDVRSLTTLLRGHA